MNSHCAESHLLKQQWTLTFCCLYCCTKNFPHFKVPVSSVLSLELLILDEKKPDIYISNLNLNLKPTSSRHAWNDNIFYIMKMEKGLFSIGICDQSPFNAWECVLGLWQYLCCNLADWVFKLTRKMNSKVYSEPLCELLWEETWHLHFVTNLYYCLRQKCRGLHHVFAEEMKGVENFWNKIY